MPIPTPRIKQNVEDQLYWDSRIDESNVTVEVTDRKVTLIGSVPTYTAKQAAETDAWVVPGVVSVKNQIAVKYPSAVSVPTDDEIGANIKNVFIWNPVIDETDINVNVTAGIVTLKGTVDSFWKKKRAEELALDMRGVLDVTNELSVVPTKGFVDESIAKDIISALERNVNVNVDNIDVEVKEGIVTLTGTVPNWYGFLAAHDAALYTPGVVDVENYLTVKEAIA
jgi:osmotically-inducible protein OsmY